MGHPNRDRCQTGVEANKSHFLLVVIVAIPLFPDRANVNIRGRLFREGKDGPHRATAHSTCSAHCLSALHDRRPQTGRTRTGLRARESCPWVHEGMREWEARQAAGEAERTTHGMRVAGGALPLSFNSSCLCMTSVVNGAMFSDAGKRTGASILRAADLSADLCSNRCSRPHGREGQPGQGCGCDEGETPTLNWKLRTGGSFRMLIRFVCAGIGSADAL